MEDKPTDSENKSVDRVEYRCRFDIDDFTGLKYPYCGMFAWL